MRLTLRSRMLLAFTTVTVAAIALVTAAALVGTTQGLSAQASADRQDVARRAAGAAADAYVRAGGWDQADLGPVLAIATGGNAQLRVVDLAGDVVASTLGRGGMGNGTGTGMGNGHGGMGNGQGTGMGNGQGTGMGNGQGTGMAGGRRTQVPAAVTVGGATVGTVTLVFAGTAQQAARPVAWWWVGLAAAVALTLAVTAAWWFTRMLTRPLAALTATARAFAAGDRRARTGVSAPGELGELAAAFDHAADQVQLSEQARRQMSADVAHELRTPLAGLQAGLEELRDGLVPADAAALARLHDQSLRLGRVVADLAELAGADAVRLTLRPDPVDLTTVAGKASDAQEAALRAAGLTLVRDLDQASPVRGDADRLHQVVENLLQNCVRHCRPGDTVTLTVRRAPVGGLVRMTVADTGPGIAPADLPHVFTRFWRSGQGGGSGLGLPIVRAIVEAHDGTVEVDSDGHSGTRVTVQLPPSGSTVPGRADYRATVPRR
jgi:two-component system sensor histidine kinase BaeS